MALKLGIQTYQILTNDDEVCNPSLSSILLAVYKVGLSVLYCSWKKCDQWGFFCQSTGLQVDSKLNELLRHFFRFSSKTVSGSRFSKKKERKRPNLKWFDAKYISSTLQCSFLFNPISLWKMNVILLYSFTNMLECFFLLQMYESREKPREITLIHMSSNNIRIG